MATINEKMMIDNLPLQGWSGDIQEKSLSDEALEEIMKDLKLPPEKAEDFKMKLRRFCENFIQRAIAYQQQKSQNGNKQLATRLHNSNKKISKSLPLLQAELNIISARDIKLLMKQYPSLKRPQKADEWLKKLQNDLFILDQLCAVSIKPYSSNSANLLLREFILDLQQLWEDTSHKKAKRNYNVYGETESGEFLGFIGKVMQRLDQKLLEDLDIASNSYSKAIRTALKRA